MPDGSSVVDTRSTAISSGVWSKGKLTFPVSLRIAGRDSPGLLVGNSYTITGNFTGPNLCHEPHFTFLAGNTNLSTVDTNERQRIQVRGVGTIKKTQRFPINNEHGDSLLEVIVHHREQRARGGFVRVRCLLGWSLGAVDPAVDLFVGSRIFYSGILDGFDKNSGKLIVEVMTATVNFAVNLIEDEDSSSGELPDADDF
ncbi:hypothetical protein MJO28_010793 [Puccinia striiformis f. sp. tritici]|uniref:Uncharacterized protein n=1 Tax=Puccinia striiformis f. sp. tritici TaxID=168172 RepID=A0ACC0E8P3_9BASI|nr:hypothetical protein MJO28_010793 [Puccinia striiformis f. sp. tritici]